MMRDYAAYKGMTHATHLVPAHKKQRGLARSSNKAIHPRSQVGGELSRISAPIQLASDANLLRQFPNRPVSGQRRLFVRFLWFPFNGFRHS